ncbi:MAG: hypothetical protein ABIG42_00665, partial [bacterium]
MAKKKRDIRKEFLEKEIHLPEYEPDSGGETIALVYPNNYKIGMSSLAYLTVYRHLIEDGFRPERFFLDIHDSKLKPISIEKGTSLNSFSKIAFHFSFELDYINAISMLIASGIEHDRKSRRKRKGAFLVAGGICPTTNPLPVMDFFDAVYVGELDQRTLTILKGGGFDNKLKDAEETGWLVFDDSSVDITGITVKQHVCPDWQEYASFSPIITPNAVFGMMNLIEISRGCPVRCKFCLAGNLHKNVREKSSDLIVDSALLLGDITKQVGLIGAIPSAH